MQQFLAEPAVELVIVLTVLAILIAIGVYVVGKLRGSVAEDQEGPAADLSKFREMHERGDVSDQEFREIKSQLAVLMQAESNDNDPAG